MKTLLATTVLLLAATVLLLAATLHTSAQTPNVTYIDHDKVAAALAKGTSLMTAPNVTVSGAHRTGPGQVEVHDKETDVLYIIEGEATFVSGGTMVGGRVTEPNQHRGKSITGGEAHQLTKGDVVVIPAGIPHWFKEVPRSIDYYVVKVLKP